MPSAPRPQLSRSPSWPSTLSLTTDVPKSTTVEPGSLSATPAPKVANHILLEDDSEDHPEDHFLSPMYEYEDWASDSDGEEEVEWDAGITDFALFDYDRRHAQESHERLDQRWTPFMQSQHSALRRAVQRTQSDSVIDTTRPPLPFDELPDLTPDTSPQLRDDLDVPSYHGQIQSRPSVPDYLTVTVTPPSPHEQTFGDDDDLPLSFSLRRSQPIKPARRKLDRPGLRHARTMSGKLHSWRRPGWNIYPLGEDREAESKAEAEPSESIDERGRER